MNKQTLIQLFILRDVYDEEVKPTSEDVSRQWRTINIAPTAGKYSRHMGMRLRIAT